MFEAPLFFLFKYVSVIFKVPKILDKGLKTQFGECYIILEIYALILLLRSILKISDCGELLLTNSDNSNNGRKVRGT